MEDGQGIWCFGVHGAARLVVSAEADGFLVYRHDEGRSWVIPRVDDMAAWLGVHEREFAG